jgi:hypothetical protein
MLFSVGACWNTVFFQISGQNPVGTLLELFQQIFSKLSAENQIVKNYCWNVGTLEQKTANDF